MKNSLFKFIAPLIMLLLLSIPFLVTNQCTSETDFNKAKQQLETQGYTDIEMGGHAWFCCDEKDLWSTTFRAKDKNGNVIEGCVCSGILKGVTIRFK